MLGQYLFDGQAQGGHIAEGRFALVRAVVLALVGSGGVAAGQDARPDPTDLAESGPSWRYFTRPMRFSDDIAAASLRGKTAVDQAHDADELRDH